MSVIICPGQAGASSILQGHSVLLGAVLNHQQGSKLSSYVDHFILQYSILIHITSHLPAARSWGQVPAYSRWSKHQDKKPDENLIDTALTCRPSVPTTQTFCQESKLRPRLITIKISVCCLQPELWNCGLEVLFLRLRRKGVVNYCKVSMLTVKIRLMGRLHAFLLCTSRSFTSFAQF